MLAAGAAAWAVDLARGPWARRRAALLAAALAGAIVVAGLFAAMHGSGALLGSYLRGAAEVSAGYSAATVGGPRFGVLLALAVAFALVATGLAAWRERKPTLLAMIVVVLFLAWKHGFVRQDEHVVLYFATALGLAAIVLAAVRQTSSRALTFVVMLFAGGAFAFASHVEPPSLSRIVTGAGYLATPVATQSRLAAAGARRLALDRLPGAARAAIGSASVDVWPTETAIVAANGLRWDPLPVFQAYQAYTPALDALNHDALVARGADVVLYQNRQPDQRLPFGETPATTVALACRYRTAAPALVVVDTLPYAVLRRTSAGDCTSIAAGTTPAEIGRPIAIPAARTPRAFVVAYIDVHPTPLARIAKALWRTSPAFIEVTYADGTIRGWRFLVPNANDGLIISTAPRTTAEAARFFAAAPTPAVRSIRILARRAAYVMGTVRFVRMTRT